MAGITQIAFKKRQRYEKLAWVYLKVSVWADRFQRNL